MSMQDELRDIRKRFEESGIAPAKLRVLDDHVEFLRTSGAAERAIAVGAQAPDFSLSCALGSRVHLASELAHGPVVLSWYRGTW